MDAERGKALHAPNLAAQTTPRDVSASGVTPAVDLYALEERYMAATARLLAERDELMRAAGALHAPCAPVRTTAREVSASGVPGAVDLYALEDRYMAAGARLLAERDALMREATGVGAGPACGLPGHAPCGRCGRGDQRDRWRARRMSGPVGGPPILGEVDPNDRARCCGGACAAKPAPACGCGGLAEADGRSGGDRSAMTSGSCGDGAARASRDGRIPSWRRTEPSSTFVGQPTRAPFGAFRAEAGGLPQGVRPVSYLGHTGTNDCGSSITCPLRMAFGPGLVETMTAWLNETSGLWPALLPYDITIDPRTGVRWTDGAGAWRTYVLDRRLAIIASIDGHASEPDYERLEIARRGRLPRDETVTEYATVGSWIVDCLTFAENVELYYPLGSMRIPTRAPLTVMSAWLDVPSTYVTWGLCVPEHLRDVRPFDPCPNPECVGAPDCAGCCRFMNPTDPSGCAAFCCGSYR